MNRYAALLYSVVLSPERRVKSSDLLDVAARAGLGNSRTVLSTGNLVFEATGSAASLEARLEAAIRDRLGKSVPVFVRDADDWLLMMQSNPFPAETAVDPARVTARILRKDLPADVMNRINARTGPQERFVAGDRTLWLYCPGPLSGSPLTRAAGAVWAGEGTFRNASALAKIADALGV